MKRSNRVMWLARFDIEPILSSTSRNGLLLSVALVGAGLFIQWVTRNPMPLGHLIRAGSLPLLILADFQHVDSPSFLPQLLTHLGIVVLISTPYLRVALSFIYFSWIERDLKHSLFTGLVLILLTILLFTNLV